MRESEKREHFDRTVRDMLRGRNLLGKGKGIVSHGAHSDHPQLKRGRRFKGTMSIVSSTAMKDQKPHLREQTPKNIVVFLRAVCV